MPSYDFSICRNEHCPHCGVGIMLDVTVDDLVVVNIADSRPHVCVLQSGTMKQPTLITTFGGLAAELSTTDLEFIDRRPNIVRAAAAATAAVAAGLRLNGSLGSLDLYGDSEYLRWEKYLRRLALDVVLAGREAQDWCNAEIDRAVTNQIVILECKGQLTLFDGASAPTDDEEGIAAA